MRRVTAFFVALVMLLLMTSYVIADKYIVNTESTQLIVRDPEDSSNILGQVNKGTILDVLYTDKFWAYIEYKGMPGKVYKSYLLPVDSSSTTQTSRKNSSPSRGSSSISKVTVVKKTVSTDDASMVYAVSSSVKNFINVRTDKSMRAKIIGKLYPGDEVYVLKHGIYWSKVVYLEQEAYVLSKYIYFKRSNLPEEGELYSVNVGKNETLNVRATPKKDGKIVAEIGDGVYIKVIEKAGKNDEWSLIYYNMKDSGYVMNKFILPQNE